MEPLDDDYFTRAEAVRLENGDYLFPNGFIFPDPDVQRPCESPSPGGGTHGLLTQGRVMWARDGKPLVPVKVQVLCNSCREAHQVQYEVRRPAKITTQAPVASGLLSGRGIDELLNDLDALIGANDPEAA